MKWQLVPATNDIPYEDYPEIPAPVVRILWNRGLTTQSGIDHWLHPEYATDCLDPYLFRAMRLAVDRIFQAREQQEKVVIHGDYDADGVAAATILYTVLLNLGLSVEVFLPHREKDGYGLNPHTIEDLKSQGAQLIITCDCGISNRDEVALAKTLDIDVIITDHHQVPEILPEAVAIIHPRVKGETYPFIELAGGGVAFKLAQGIIHDQRSGWNERQIEAQEKWLLDLVAISTVADMVSLTGENRALVKYGLMVLRKNKRLGLAALLETAKLEPQQVSEQSISFQIAPRLNAAGRMDHASGAFYLLIESDPAKAAQLAQALNDANTRRQKETETMFRSALAQNPDSSQDALFFYDDRWPLGLTGLVAGRLVKHYNRPCFVLGHDGDKIVGSGRSIPGLDIYQAVKQAEELLIAFGGHSQACGFRLPTDQLKIFQDRVTNYVRQRLPDLDTVPELTIDTTLMLPDINWELLDYLAFFPPFGLGNEQPLFMTADVTVNSAIMVGKDLNHWKLSVEQAGRKLPAIAFDQKHLSLKVADHIDMVYAVTINEWNGNREIQLQIKDIKPHE
ncbi:MAG: single-stranded-DNA-specific exonuclease RecJ [Candidatus Komeilibacteria bacterium]